MGAGASAQLQVSPSTTTPPPTLLLPRHRSQYRDRILPGLQACSTSAERKQRIRFLARNDLFFLLVYLLRRPDADHDFVFDRCREVQASPDNHIDLWSRGHYKSTIITFALTIQEILINPDITIGIFSFSRPIAKQFLRQIKSEFEQNDMLKWAFDDILWDNPKGQASKWSEDDGIIVKRKSNPKESTVEAWGLVDGQPTSKHFKRMVYDDVVTDSSVTTPEQIKKTTDAWALSRNLVSKGSKTRIIGTRYHYFDSYHELLKRGFKERKWQATKNGQVDGEPWMLTRAELQAKLVEMGSQTFAAQMMQEPRLDKDAFFKPEHLKRYKVYPPLDRLMIYGGSDYAVTKNGGDFTVHVVVGVDADWNIYVLDLWRAQEESHVWVDVKIDMMQRYRPMAWGAPQDQIKKSIGPFLNQRMMERHAYCEIVELIEAGQDKVKKARSIQARCSLGKVFFPAEEVDEEIGYEPPAWMADLESEMLLFPLGKNDDQVDALSVIGRLLDEMIAAGLPVIPQETAANDYGDDDSTGGDKVVI